MLFGYSFAGFAGSKLVPYCVVILIIVLKITGKNGKWLKKCR